MRSSMRNIDAIDEKILAQLDVDCRQSNMQIARKAGVSREVVAYRIKRMEEQGIIRNYIASVNPHALGVQLFRVYVQLENDPGRREEFLKFLRSQKNMYWIGTVDGAWDFIFVVYASTVLEFYAWKNVLFDKFSDSILRRETGLLVDVQQFTAKVFKNSKPGSVLWGGALSTFDADAIDRTLLDVLSHDARISVVALAALCKTNTSMIIRKMKRLKECGVIVQYRAAIDWQKLGMESYKAIISVKSLSQYNHGRLNVFLQQHPNCTYYIRTITPWEIEVEFLASGYREFTTIIAELRTQFSDIVRTVETVILDKEWWLPGYDALLKH